MFRPLFMLSSGTSIQKPSKGRNNKNLSALLVHVNLDPGSYVMLRDQSSNNTLFAKYMLELYFRMFLFSFL